VIEYKGGSVEDFAWLLLGILSVLAIVCPAVFGLLTGYYTI